MNITNIWQIDMCSCSLSIEVSKETHHSHVVKSTLSTKTSRQLLRTLLLVCNSVNKGGKMFNFLSTFYLNCRKN
jgi:hypothetical protein